MTLQEVSMAELYGLSVRANIAYAARCARRAEPLIRFAPTEADVPAAAAEVQRVIQLAEVYAFGAHVQATEAELLARSIGQRATDAAQARHYALSSIAHLANAIELCSGLAAPPGDDAFKQVVIGCYSVSRALLANNASPAIWRALRSDLAELQALVAGGQDLLGQSVDCSADGPLGPL